MVSGIPLPQAGFEQPLPPWKERLHKNLRIAGLVLLVVVAAIPVAAIAAFYLFSADIDRAVRDWAARAEEIEPPELEGRTLDMLTRKLGALQKAKEAQPWFTVTVAEMNSYINYMSNLGALPPALTILRVEGDGDLVRIRTVWTGQQMARLMTSWGFSSSSQIWGPVVGYVNQLARLQLDVWVRPAVERGALTWNIERSRLNGTWAPTSLAEYLERKALPQGRYYKIGPAHLELKAASMTPGGLKLTWGPAAPAPARPQ